MPIQKIEKTMHQSTLTAGDKEVGGKRRRQQIKRGVSPGGWEVVVQGEAEAAMQQPVRADDKRQRQDDKRRCWQTGGNGMTRCNAM